MTAADVAQLDTVESLTGKALDITVEGETVKVNGATVLTAELDETLEPSAAVGQN